MPTVNFKISRLRKLIGKELSINDLENALSSLGTAVETIHEDLIEVEIFPNRPDLLSEEGVARALRYYLGLDHNLKNYNMKKGKEEVFLSKEALEVRPYVRMFIARNVKNFDFDSIIQLQEKLHVTHGRRRKAVSIGVHNLDVITFPVYYKGVKKNFKFIPLGWEREATIKEILETHEKGIAYAHLLENTSIYPVWVDSKGVVLALPPIINGVYTVIDEHTKNFVVDVTGLDEKKVDETARILAAHFFELTNEVYDVKIEGKYLMDMSYKKKIVSKEEVKSYLGVEMSLKDMLLKMGMGYEDKGNNFYALVPPYRTDILHPIDVIEDIAIAYGYENFDASLPSIATIGGEADNNKLFRALQHIFTGMGAIEVMNYHLSNEDVLFLRMNRKPEKLVKVEKPMNQEYDVLRTDLMPLLLHNLQHNKLHEYPQFLFEIGSVFKGIEENNAFAFVYAGKDANFSKAKGIVERIVKDLGASYKIKETNEPYFIEGRAAFIISKVFEGKIGEIHPQILNNFDLELPVIAGEFRLIE